MDMNLDAYYRSLAAERLQELADSMLRLSQEAERSAAHDAAWRLADLSTELLEMGLGVAGQRTPPSGSTI
jgi:hypothetical protein